MTQLVITAPHEPRGIVVQTRKGKPIENANTGSLTPFYLQQAREWHRLYPDTSVSRRTEPLAHYNCHGLTFASRRTRITRTQDIRQILAEDGYRRVTREDVRPGDVILYVAASGDIEHSGIVIWADNDRVPFCALPERRSTFLVLSKWGFGEEILHRETMCPYTGLTEFYRVMNGMD